ncbi:hypothetical protein AB0E69_33830 [Kribbella sp. NPDC026611]|uniref:hypothetical protein n=1 Tax=Kribbella sp. NPDC026611 TaxID=3154911 RepID=UPI0034076B07
MSWSPQRCTTCGTRYFDRELIESLAAGWVEHEVEEIADGTPVRRLWQVIQRKA